MENVEEIQPPPPLPVALHVPPDDEIIGNIIDDDLLHNNRFFRFMMMPFPFHDEEIEEKKDGGNSANAEKPNHWKDSDYKCIITSNTNPLRELNLQFKYVDMPPFEFS